MRRDLVTSVLAVLVLTVVLGLAYPLLVTGVAQVAFPGPCGRLARPPRRQGGRLSPARPAVRHQDGTQGLAPGPALLPAAPVADRITAPRPRPSPTAARTTPARPRSTAARCARYLALERPYTRGLTAGRVPIDAVTTSASGVDPHISPANARIQSNRVARVRHLALARVRALVDEHTDGRALGVLGEPGVNVTELNLALDRPPMTVRAAPSSRPTCSCPAVAGSLRKLDPRIQVRNPVMFVVELGAVITTAAWLIQLFGGGPLGGGVRSRLVHVHGRVLAVAHRRLRQPRRGARRRPGPGPGRRPARDAHDDDRAPRRRHDGRGRRPAARRRRRRRGRRDHPGRRHDHRGHRVGRRVGHHRRVGAGDPRSRRRPQRRHRRDAGALRPDRRGDHPGAGPVVPGPDDRAGRGRRAAQDPERDRAEHPARRADARLPRGRRHAAAVRALRRHRDLGRRR